MVDDLDTLHRKMAEAASAQDFEAARRYRDMIGMIRGGATPDEAARADFDGLERQRPGAMGLGTSQQRTTPPAGWRPPPKPDPMTAGRPSRGQRRGP